MKKPIANLHIPKKKAIIITASFSVLSVLIYVLSLFTMKGALGQLHALCQSKYVFSGIAHAPSSQDSYYQLNAGISMALSADAKNSLNVDIVMQTEKANYTQNVSWNTNTLEKNEVAITQSIANTNSLTLGDILYSKHVVTGKVEAYIIKDILSEATTTNEVRNRFSDGIIIMGYDETYVSNISLSTIVYMDKPTEAMIKADVELPTTLTYRADEIQIVINRLVPFFVIFLLLAVAASITLVAFLSKEVMPNMRRLMLLGTESGKIDYSYRQHLYGSGMIALVAALTISVIIALLKKCCVLSLVVLFVLSVIQFLAIHCSLHSILRRFWRT